MYLAKLPAGRYVFESLAERIVQTAFSGLPWWVGQNYLIPLLLVVSVSIMAGSMWNLKPSSRRRPPPTRNNSLRTHPLKQLECFGKR